MNPPFAANVWILAGLACAVPVASVAALLAGLRRRRGVFWISFACAVLAGCGAWRVFLRLDGLHADLAQGGPGLKTKEDLLKRYGAPSRTDFYTANGTGVECWIYETGYPFPRGTASFEMIDGRIWAHMRSGGF